MAFAAAALCACTAFAAHAPQAALATYADVSDELPATQELGSTGDPVYGAQVPDGSYTVTARTTSRMCIMYASRADAKDKKNKERCTLRVSGGSMSVEFYLSAAYNRVYLGSASEAALMTDASGDLDSDAYLKGDPPSGYEPHFYTFAIPALNEVLEMAAYNGGNKTHSQAKWFDRYVAFMPTDELMRAIEGGGQEGSVSGSNAPEANPGKDQKDSPTSAGAKGPGGKETGGLVVPELPNTGGGKVGDGAGATGQGAVSGGSSSGAAASAAADAAGSGSRRDERATAAAASPGDMGKAAFGVGYVAAGDAGASAEGGLPTARAVQDGSPQAGTLAAACACAALFLAGAAARCLMFRRGLRSTPELQGVQDDRAG